MTLQEITSFSMLRRAARRAARDGAWRSRGAARWLADLEANSLDLQRRLRGGMWWPGRPTRFRIRDPKPRLISAPPFEDRVVHHALCAALEPRLERLADPDSYACRVGKGAHAAVRRLQRLVRKPRHAWYVKVDVRHYFETVPHERLMRRLDPLLTDPALRELVDRIVTRGTGAGRGLPIGALTSQHFGNHYLGAVDHHARHTLRVGGWLRYMDDMIALVPDREAGRDARTALGHFVDGVLGQTLKHEVSVLAPTYVGVPFLGFRVWPNQIRFDGARRRRLGRTLRLLGTLDEAAAGRRASSVIAWAEMADSRTWRRTWFERRGLT